MAKTELIFCGAGRRAATEHHLRLGARDDGSDANVFLDVDRIHRAFLKEIPAVDRDLIEVAAYVYAADQMVGRGTHGLPPKGALGAGWRRQFCFQIPVRRPDVWRAPAVLEALAATLGFVSDDVYEFQFRPLDPRAGLQARFGDADPYEGLIDEVVLFSGGLDSLAGAVEEAVVAKRRVLLVNHRSTPKVTARHKRLVNGLLAKAPGPRPFFIPVALNKKKEFSRCRLQRTRTFLYAALAAVLARLVGRDRVRFYENGVVGLNLPFAPQVVGARATRGTHPRALNGFAALFGRLTGTPFAVENPFVWDTKADVVNRIARAGCGDLIAYTTSCAETPKRTTEHPHCGVCSQCIDRRVAVLAAGLAAHDPAGGYEVELFTGPRADGPARTMLASYVERARRLRRMGPLAFVQQYGEVVRVLRALADPPADVAAQVYQLYRRHADEVGDVVTAGIRAHDRALWDGTLEESCLLRMVLRGAADPAPRPPARAANAIARRGPGWVIRFRGGRDVPYPDDVGYGYLARLFRTPNAEVEAEALEVEARRQAVLGDRSDDLFDGPAAAAGVGGGNSAGDDALDRRGEEDLRRRLAEIDGLLAAYAGGDGVEGVDAVDELEAERGRIDDHLRGARGLRGRRRQVGDRVSKALRRAVKRFEKADPPLWAHLRKPVLTTGYAPAYRPGPEVFWASELDAPQ